MSKKKEIITNTLFEAGVNISDTIFGLFAQIPGAPTQALVTFAKGIAQYREEVIVENLCAFFAETKDVTENEKEKFLEKLDDDQEAFYKRMIVAVERLDDAKKAAMSGKLFRALLKNKISIGQFRSLLSVVPFAFLDDLEFLYRMKSKNFSEMNNLAPFDSSRGPSSHTFMMQKKLVALGLMYETILTMHGSSNVTFEINDLGKAFVDNAF